VRLPQYAARTPLHVLVFFQQLQSNADIPLFFPPPAGPCFAKQAKKGPKVQSDAAKASQMAKEKAQKKKKADSGEGEAVSAAAAAKAAKLKKFKNDKRKKNKQKAGKVKADSRSEDGAKAIDEEEEEEAENVDAIADADVDVEGADEDGASSESVAPTSKRQAKLLKQRLRAEKRAATSGKSSSTAVNTASAEQLAKKRKLDTSAGSSDEEEDESGADSVWGEYGLPDTLVQGLLANNIIAPTPIQKLALPAALTQRRDVVAAAETGSGKTLAYGLPILAQLTYQKADGALPIGLQALIICPTRELALQVRDHLTKVAGPTGIRIEAIVGGLALAKQSRVLAARPPIVVATPGRLWELMTMGEKHFSSIRRLRFLVIDEADKMVEAGHFKELRHIIEYLVVKEETADANPTEVEGKLVEKKGSNGEDKPPAKSTDADDAESDEDGNVDEAEEEEEEEEDEDRRPVIVTRQTFIYSATMFEITAKGWKHAERNPLEHVAKMCKLRENFAKIDLTVGSKMAQKLQEARVVCTEEEKDSVLYYFLNKYPGRTLVFVNSIDCIRRLVAILSLCEVPILALHANMQQRQRLKNLQRFIDRDNSILLATDVAARGLDIKGIKHVLHYQMPRDPETYVHRSGRTARALQEGLAVALLGPDDMFNYQKVIRQFNDGDDLAQFPIDTSVLATVQKRIDGAEKVDAIERKTRKTNTHNSWFQRQAEEMDIELDDGLLKETGDAHEAHETKMKLASCRAKLKALLAIPLLEQGRGSGARGRVHIPLAKADRGKKFAKVEGAALDIVKEKVMKQKDAKQKKKKQQADAAAAMDDAGFSVD
jgi:ATP-dependent RNA helicase DDX24/MAK5